MNETLRFFLTLYASLSSFDLVYKMYILNSCYLKAKKASNNLKFRKGLTQESKLNMKIPKIVNLSVIAKNIKQVPIPIYTNICTAKLIFNSEEIYKQYCILFREMNDRINKIEQDTREYVTEVIKDVKEHFPNELPDQYKKYNLNNNFIGMSKKEMLKMFKRYGIMYKENYTDDNCMFYEIGKCKKYKNR